MCTNCTKPELKTSFSALLRTSTWEQISLDLHTTVSPPLEQSNIMASLLVCMIYLDSKIFRAGNFLVYVSYDSLRETQIHL